MGEAAAIYCVLPVAINRFDTTFPAAPTYCPKVSRSFFPDPEATLPSERLYQIK